VCGSLLGAEPFCRTCDRSLKVPDVSFGEVTPKASRVAFARKSRASDEVSAYFRGRKTSVARTLAVIGDRWSWLMIYELLCGPRRFEDFSTGLGVAPNILADRLRFLTNA